jgi:pre-mRNA-splicing factor CWC22
VRRSGFKDFPAVLPELDIVEAEDQITHQVFLNSEDLDTEQHLDVFKVDPDFKENEKRWALIKKEIIGGGGSDSDSDSSSDSDSDSGNDGSSSDSDSSDSSESEAALVPVEPDPVLLAASGGGINGQPPAGSGVIHDFSEKDLINLRRTIYLTLVSSATPEECAHKMLKIDLQEGQEIELCAMVLECCSQDRT